MEETPVKRILLKSEIATLTVLRLENGILEHLTFANKSLDND